MPTSARKIATSEAKAALAKLEDYSAEQLAARAIARRAVEAVNWGLPAVNLDLMFSAMVGLGGKANEIVYWSKLADWKNQTLTPNSDTLYFMPFFTTKDGPVVIDIPPAEGGSITGTIMDAWQSALEDVGPAGVDKGKGGKYLVTPPGYAKAPPKDMIALPSMTYGGYALLRSIIKSRSDTDVAAAAAYGRRIKLYPLAEAASPPATVFHDASGAVFDSTNTYDLQFFEALDRLVQAEPWLARDKAMIDVLRTLGIEKGKPFRPDGATKDILAQAAAEARDWLNARFESGFEPYYEDERWTLPAKEDLRQTAPTFYEAENMYSVDSRGLTDFWAFSTVKHLGVGQFYLVTLRDADGELLDGGNTYRLTVPADAPVRQFWSATVYDRATNAFIREVPATARSSQTVGLQTRSDGAVDLLFAPAAPKGREANWVPTKTGGKFEVLFRFYGPEKALFDKSWKLPDIEKMS